MSKVLIIIVTFNGIDHIRSCLSPLINIPENMKCMVIDNGSTDGTPELIKKEFPFVKLVKNYENLGFGAANNIGLKMAVDEGYDYVYLLNQDAWITPKNIQLLVDIAKKNPEYGIISPMQLYADKNKIDDNFSGKITKEMKDDYMLPYNVPKELYRIKGRSLQAAHWLVTRKALTKAGGFSPTFFHYGEDDNLCKRMEFHGFKLGIAPNILAVHNRENRIITSSYKLLLRKNELKKIASDPFLSDKAIYRNLVPVLFLLFLDYKLRFIPLFFDFIKSYPQIRRNRKISINRPRAFLN